MQSKQLVYLSAAVWLVLFVASFVVLQATEPQGDGFTRGLNRVASFLSWQGAALVVAIICALLTQHAVRRGVERVKMPGYLPLVLSVFVVGVLIAMIAYRVLVQPSFG
jgi:hypothetical protein